MIDHKHFVRSLTAVTMATAMLGAATCCYVAAGLGSDAVAVFNEGFSITTGLSMGTASVIYSCAMLMAALLAARKNIGWTTVFNCVFCGVFIDLANWVLAPVFGFSGALWYRWGLFGAGLVLVAASCAIMMRFCPGMSVMDAIASRICEKLGCSFRVVRMCMDSLTMVSGWLMGGVVGVGSVVAVLCTGPLIQWFLRLGKKS